MVLAWQTYNRHIAENNKLVGHGRPSDNDPGILRNSFFRNNDFLEQQIANEVTIHSPYVVCGPVAGKPAGSPPAYKMTIRATLYFLAHVDGTNDNLEQVQDLTFTVMAEWISRYLFDHEEQGMCGPFTNLKLDRLSWEQIGPMGQDDYGWRLMIDFQEKGDAFVYDPSKWFS